MATNVMSNEIELERLFASSNANIDEKDYHFADEKCYNISMRRCNLFEIADGCRQEHLSACPISEDVEAWKNESSEPLRIPEFARTTLCRSNSLTELDRHGRGDLPEDGQLLEIDGEFVLRPLPERPGSLQSNPYIGTFHHGHQANRLPRSSVSSDGSGDSWLNCSSCSCILTRSESCCSDKRCANLNRAARAASCAMAKSACCAIPHRNFFLPSSAPAEAESEKLSPPRRCSPEERRLDVKVVDTKDHKNLMKQALRLQEDIPASAELCGLQALLPKQAGVRVLQLIGEGTFGKCVKVMNKRNCQSWNVTEKRRHLFSFPQEGEQLAIKCVYRESGTASGDTIDREIRVHGKCDHPNIVKLYGYYELGGTVALILGFVEGSELHDVLQVNRRLEEEVCASIFLQVLRAVHHMHGISIIHRDIKPRNVLLATSGRAYVIDLGLAVDMSDQGDTAIAHEQAAAGTIGYLPPEVLKEQEDAIDFAMDIWALGITLYEMMFGFAPFLPHEVSLPTVVEFPDPSWGMLASSDMRELIVQLLDKNPRTRIRSGDALAHSWFTADRVKAVDKIIGGAQAGAAGEGAMRPDEEMQFDLELNDDLSMELDMHNRVSGDAGSERRKRTCEGGRGRRGERDG
uniref:Protein kinase domain-containing protein n=1 Tax=Hanusia phi TaxID=3032 RepID=A0A7S0EAX6_9CRYP|mmetsp:Transcript_20647/g.46724  ORF Transcript_20647/g.46724 Transcript_20647/m.46724 type:complete len:632 (+) Transcript_20647:196-2091(+)